jgi:sarcosine oxidase subunit alpha
MKANTPPPFRIDGPSRLDRERPISFSFNGKTMTGHIGDTLASALIANGVHLVARSMKYHRPRGFIASGVEDPNSMVQLGTGNGTEPNAKATIVQLYDGLSATSVNVWPSVETDIGSVNQMLSPFMTAGFYYKTFMPSQAFWNRVAEPFIRNAAGFGKAPEGADPDFYDHAHVHCDVLVVGGGPTGLAAAHAAAATGARVIIADEQFEMGGSLLASGDQIGDLTGMAWAAKTISAIEDAEEATVLPRTTVVGLYDQNYAIAVERRTDHQGAGRSSIANVRQRLWHIRAKRIIVAAGAHERAMVFANNDRPGIMLADAAKTFVRRYAALPGKNAILVTNNDHAYDAALAMKLAGADVRVLDTRKTPTGALPESARAAGIEVEANVTITGVKGAKRVAGVDVADMTEDATGIVGTPRSYEADCVLMSGGYSPAVHLFCHAQGKLRYDDDLACFRPGMDVPGMDCVGGSNGDFGLDACLAQGYAAGEAAARTAGFKSRKALRAPSSSGAGVKGELAIEPIWQLPAEKAPNRSKAKFFVDFQNDTSAADIAQAAREGFDSVEHMKRYTLTGFGTDQGKIGNINGLAILAQITGRTIQETGTTTFRPPYTPVTFGTLAGRAVGDQLDPIRVTAIQDSHVNQGAVFEDVGQWKRPWYFPVGSEDMHAAVKRECRAVRTSVGLLDASTLGKIDVSGPDAAEFLDRVYSNMMSSLKVGSVRYGLMLGEDGMVSDDGTVARLSDNQFIATTTTGGAAGVFERLEDYLQTEWMDLKVYLTSVTEQWATVAVAGPKARMLVERLCSDIDFDPEAFPFMTFREGTVNGISARVFRISFTGELSYEINVAWHHGRALWDALMDAGADLDVTPYGTETMHVLRAEKGFIIVGQETDGTMTADDLGMNWIVSKKKHDFIGKRSLSRPDNLREDRKQLVGILPEDGSFVLPEGAQLVQKAVSLPKVAQFQPPGLKGEPIYRQKKEGRGAPIPIEGHVTSSYWSDALDRSFGLALIKNGRARHGELLHAPLEDRTLAVRIVDPVFYDRDGRRRDG